jgi:plastocyanin
VKRTTTAAAVLAAVLATAGLAACGDDDSGPPTVQTGVVDERGKAAVEVDAIDNVFNPYGVRVDVGATVKWTNDGRVGHNIIVTDQPDGAGDDFGVVTSDFLSGDTYEYTFTTPGTYSYYCSLHGTPTSGMIGVVVAGD